VAASRYSRERIVVGALGAAASLLALLLLLVPCNLSPAFGQQIGLTGKYALSGHFATTTTGQSFLFQDNFESDDTDLVPTWDYRNSTNVTLNTNPTYSHGGSNSGQFYYFIASGGDASQDANRWASKVVTGQADLHLRGYLYLKTPEGDNTSTGTQRKLIWLSDSTDATDNMGNYQVVLDGWATAGTPNYTSLSWLSQGTGGGCGLTSAQHWDIASLNYDTWYSVEFEAILNTPSVANGYAKLWINGSLVYTSSATDQLRGTCSGNLSFADIGVQVNRTDSTLVDEYRYWDDVAISASYIGP